MSNTFLQKYNQIRNGIDISALILEALTLLSMSLKAFVQIFPILGAGSI
jgi:hypothetical protein